MKFELAVRCPVCGKWRALITENLKTAQLSCFDCGKAVKIRNSKGWNVQHKFPIQGQDSNVLVQLLNMRDRDGNKL